MNTGSNSIFNSYDPVTYNNLDINNAAGATAVGETTATLNGYLMSSGPTNANVYVFYGDADGGTNLAASTWDFSVNIGSYYPGLVSATVSNLVDGRQYFYRFYATNGVGDEAWGDPPAAFRTVEGTTGSFIRFE